MTKGLNLAETTQPEGLLPDTVTLMDLLYERAQLGLEKITNRDRVLRYQLNSPHGFRYDDYQKAVEKAIHREIDPLVPACPHELVLTSIQEPSQDGRLIWIKIRLSSIDFEGTKFEMPFTVGLPAPKSNQRAH